MKILKKLSAYILAAGIAVSMFPFAVQAAPEATELSGEELVQQIRDTHRAALNRAGYRSFYNRCSQLVNYSTVVLGLQTQRYCGNGNQEYNLYEDITATDCGYDVEKYPAGEYTLEEALNAISQDGTKNVYNIIIGWQSGRSWASRRYGHTCFIHGIVDGNVYFCESYSLSIGGKHYSAGSPIVCSISQFADYYDWGVFEGAVHFDVPEIPAPYVGQILVTGESTEGFTLTFDAQNVREDGAWVKVWCYGNSADDGYLLFPAQIRAGQATVQVDTSRFDGFVGRYYAEGFAVGLDGSMNSTRLAGREYVDLYTPREAEGLYRVEDAGVYACNAPAGQINGVSTAEYEMTPGTEFAILGTLEDAGGIVWLQLDDGCWIHSDSVRRVIRVADVMEYISGVLE